MRLKYIVYMYENSIVKSHQKHLKREEVRSHLDRVSLIKVHYMYVCKYHNEISLYNLC
jgi:hypothetical protein